MVLYQQLIYLVGLRQHKLFHTCIATKVSLFNNRVVSQTTYIVCDSIQNGISLFYIFVEK
jgi:hypothetical protein